jgi:hypothetical protein
VKFNVYLKRRWMSMATKTPSITMPLTDSIADAKAAGVQAPSVFEGRVHESPRGGPGLAGGAELIVLPGQPAND